MSLSFAIWLVYYCNLYHVPLEVASAVAKAESNYSMSKVGEMGEIGYFQLLPSSFPKENLHNPENNVKLGIRYLRDMAKACPLKSKYYWVICYNMGVEGAKSVKYPSKTMYYKNVMKAMKEL